MDYLPHTVLIDCSADAEVALHYRDWLAAGIHIVTPNKKANSGTLAYYESLKARAPRERRPLPVRDHGRRGPAGDPDAARSARDRR